MSAPKFLIVKFSAIGDCVMATPVAASIRRTYPDAFIAWAVDPRCAAVLDTERLVDLRFDVPREQWKKGGPEASWRHQLRHFARLREHGFDYGLDLQGHSKTAICLRIARPRRRIAVRATDPLVRLLNPVIPKASQELHIVERNLAALRRFGEFPGDPELVLPLQSVEHENLATISVSAGYQKKVISPEIWRSVADSLMQRGMRVAFLGGPGDPSVELPGSEDLVGKLPLEETMTMVARGRIHLAADTGTGHIAAAYRVPVVSVFRNSEVGRFRPYTDLARVIDLGKDERAADPDEILQVADELLFA